jgi:CheY-like chemotaxis protein
MNRELILLIVEDNDDHFLLTKRFLNEKGITSPIVHFTDGQAILDFLSAAELLDCAPNRAYLLLLDIDMPKLSGLELLRRIKKSSRLNHVFVIILAAYADRRTIEHCYSLGCNAFFTKPLQKDDFIETLESLDIFLPAKHTTQTS